MSQYTATYSPEDNKLRLYAATRLDSETYNRVKANGFKWAPRQELFVAPMWTPSREDLLIELAGEIEDEDKSLVERQEERAERFEEYSENRKEDADRAHKAVHAIADGIPLGQPILVGHHSERHARKDAAKIENGMRKAVKMWEQSKYWTDRAAGALRHAKYKERPDVRARRIKTIEADRRKVERSRDASQDALNNWRHVAGMEDEEKRNRAALHVANVSSGLYFKFPLDRYPRKEGASTYEGDMGLWSAMDGGIIDGAQAAALAIPCHAGSLPRLERWIAHYNNRIAYERAMLDEGGGLVAEQQQIAVGGRVLVRGEWVTVLRINRKDGKACSYTTNRRYVRVIGAEEVQGYEPPSAEQAATVAAKMKVAPMCNYPGERFATCTQAEWDAINKDYRGSETREATETAARHRVRRALGLRLTLPPPEGKELEPHYCNANRTHHYWPVFITDAKRIDPPRPTKAPEDLPTILPPRKALPTTARHLDDLRDFMFEHYEETGKLRAGIRWEYAGEGQSECYQFDTLEELKACAESYQTQPRMIRFEIVTHSGEYKNMRTVYKWKAECEELDGAKFDALKDTLKAGVKVVSAPQLFPTPPELARRMVEEACIRDGMTVLEPSAGNGQLLGAICHSGVQVRATAVEVNYNCVQMLSAQRDAGAYQNAVITQGDFLEWFGCEIGQGGFDRVLMNPPFANADDIKHIRHAMTFLKPGGRLVAICANGPRQQEKLRPMIEDNGGTWEPLPAGTFESSGTGVNTVLMVYDAPEAEQQAEEEPATVQAQLF